MTERSSHSEPHVDDNWDKVEAEQDKAAVAPSTTQAETTTTGPYAEHEIPDGGMRAWLVVLGVTAFKSTLDDTY